METNVKANGQEKANAVKADKTPKFVAGNPVNNEAKAQEQKEEARQKTEARPESPATAQQEPKSEPTKKEIKAQIAEQIARQQAKLQRHIQLGDLLARKIKQRDNLSGVITTLKAFEVNLKDSEEVTDSNFYQGCQLTIRDDNGETFTTKNATIIQGVAETVLNLCTDKLEEVETDILNMIPAEI